MFTFQLTIMGLLEYIEGKESRWLWLTLTILCSFIPCIARLVVFADFHINAFDVKDLIFAGIAINLSNFSLIKGHRIEMKNVLFLFSTLANVALAFILGVILSNEAEHSNHPTVWLNIFCIIIVVFSVYLSYDANDYILKRKRHL